MRSISSMTAEIRSQTEEVWNGVHRVRNANRRMTGSTGEQPTPINVVKGSNVDKIDRELSMLDELSMAIEHLNSATAELRDELACMEGYTETASTLGMVEKGFATQGLVGRN